MIDPQKKCIWTTRKTTELTYKNNEFIGTGISLRVLLHAFVDTNFIWYSKTHGDFDDNITILAMDRDSSLLDNLEQNEQSLLKEFINTDFYFKEYALTDEIQSHLGIKFDEQGYTIEKLDCTKYQINIHDNCFSCIKLVDTEFLTKIINSVLRQHEFYLRLNVNWSNVISEITRKLIEFNTIQIKSYPKYNQISISLGKDNTNLIRKIFQPPPTFIVRVHNGFAFI